MNRQIKFRAKTTANGHWVYGSLIDYGDNTFAIRNRKSQPWVQAGSIGQFTGLLDRNGKEIYEGDIIKENDEIVEVFWCDSLASFMHEEYNSKSDAPKIFMMSCLSWNAEIIGNIHDNPELANK